MLIDNDSNRTNTGYQTGTGNNNQLSSDGTYNYTYDNEGNLKTRTEITTGKVRAFTWDYRNRLTGVTDKTGGTVTQQVSYTYDAFNQRIARTVATPTVGTQTTRFVYDRGNVYLEFSGTSTTPSTRYLYGPMVDQVLAQESNNQTTWMLTDHLGSVRDLVNNSGTVVNHFTYDSFGQVVGSTGTVDTRYKFTGREYDGETGLYYYRARYFDAGVGRFIGQDPKAFKAGDANLYRYVGNNSVGATDPSGMNSVNFGTETLSSFSNERANSSTQTGTPLAKFPYKSPARNIDGTQRNQICVSPDRQVGNSGVVEATCFKSPKTGKWELKVTLKTYSDRIVLVDALTRWSSGQTDAFFYGVFPPSYQTQFDSDSSSKESFLVISGGVIGVWRRHTIPPFTISCPSLGITRYAKLQDDPDGMPVTV